jgi:hypothetical protein
MARPGEGGDDVRLPGSHTQSQRTDLIRSVAPQHVPGRAAATRLGVTVSTAYRGLLPEGARPTTAPPPPPTFVRHVPAASTDARLREHHLAVSDVIHRGVAHKGVPEGVPVGTG